ncbi:MAG: AP endonuclease [Tenericutes bacterium HGW-Tenericutes-5]|jgi:xylose isomerase|nr:MAG: AP endonuclease [Tenericutes bacterium HGW-Tenericutes-5]
MDYSIRLNGFLSKGYSLEETFQVLSKIDGATHVDLNYPEHFEGLTVEEMQEMLNKYNLKVSSVAVRYRDGYEKGEFTNPDPKIVRRAINIAKETSDMAKKLNSNHVILWFSQDGWTYPFEVDYEKIWVQSRDCLREVCDHNKDVQISIEYKPFEPRTFSLYSSAAVTALMCKDVDRDNIFVTMDLAHVYMKDEMPSFSVSLLMRNKLLSAIHVNDGYGLQDDGLMVGSIRFIQTLEFYYYLIKYKYDKAIYFDTFPIREKPEEEVKQNIKMSNKLFELINMIGLERIEEIIKSNDAVKAQEILLLCLK